MVYEHCLIFGAREYFWDDATFHDDCIGIVIDETDRDDELNLHQPLPQTKSSKCCSTQTEPWGPPEASRSCCLAATPCSKIQSRFQLGVSIELLTTHQRFREDLKKLHREFSRVFRIAPKNSTAVKAVSLARGISIGRELTSSIPWSRRRRGGRRALRPWGLLRPTRRRAKAARRTTSWAWRQGAAHAPLDFSTTTTGLPPWTRQATAHLRYNSTGISERVSFSIGTFDTWWVSWVSMGP